MRGREGEREREDGSSKSTTAQHLILCVIKI